MVSSHRSHANSMIFLVHTKVTDPLIRSIRLHDQPKNDQGWSRDWVAAPPEGLHGIDITIRSWLSRPACALGEGSPRRLPV